MRHLRLLIAFTFIGASLQAQTSLQGKVTDADTGEPLIYANILILKNGNNIGGTTTDLDGNYSVNPIDPGTYNIEISYTGYTTQRQEDVIALAGKSNVLNIELQEGILAVEGGIEVVGYRVPLVEQDNTTQGQTITSEQIRNLPTRNINALAATTAGLSSSDEGEEIAARGSRPNSTDYYVDGIRVSGALIPESEIDQLQIITGGVGAQYGDATGAIISITTKGPSAKWSGGVEMETSEFFDAFDNRLIGFNASGPLLKRKSTGESLVGIRLSGRYTYQLDDDPPALDVYRVSDATLAELEANPITFRSNANGTVSPFIAAEFVDNDEVNTLSARPFEDNTRYDLLAKIDARLTKAIDISFTGSYNWQEDFFTPTFGYADAASTITTGRWSVFNAHNNPSVVDQTIRGNIRLRHRLSGAPEEGETSSIQNASYTLQFGYEVDQNDRSDSRHGDNFFDYGYVGNFDFEWIPTFELDPVTQSLTHTDYRQVLRGYTPGDRNPVLANYNNELELESGPDNPLNAQIPNYLLSFPGAGGNNGGVSLANFFAQNGFISNQFNSTFGGYQTNVGWVFNQYRQIDNDLYTFIANSSFELVPGGNSDKGRHSIEFGVWYEQRTDRTYIANPRSLWQVARQQANSHILGIAADADSIGTFDVPNFGETALLDLTIDESSENQFYRRVRAVTGDGLRDYVNVDGLSPDQLSLDMFSARELNDQAILDYSGYDYLGNEFNGSFDDFFTATDENGIRTFPVAPNRPIYWAGYIQDKFTFKDIIFRIGLRVDQYDANTKVLKDNYSLYEIQGASDFHAQNTDLDRPGNIGDDFKVYTNDGGSAVEAYREGDQWYFPNGNPANSPIDIFSGGLVFPAYVDERVNEVGNFIKSRDFDPNVSFTDYEPQINWMPRLAFSFPISEEANFFANYDILVQRPQSNTIATAYDYFYFTDRTGIRNNPNLQPERTITYEVGFQQKLSQSSALKLSAYYREMRDMIQRRTFFPVPIVNQYTTYDNLDFGTVKAFIVGYDLRRTGNLSFQANYTLQFADGTGSDADSQRGLTSRGNIRNLIPLNFDERHALVGIIDYRYQSGSQYNGPRIGGVDILSNFGVNIQANANSGRPYTATQIPQVRSGAGFKGELNGARLPWRYTINMRIDKSFKIGNGLNANAYVRISNLLDRRNVINVYSATGSPTDDGYLASSIGLNQLAGIESSTRDVNSFLASYQWRLLNPDNFSLPRRIFGGLIFNF